MNNILMKNNKPAYIIHYYFKRLKHYAKQIKNDFNEETIHLFRVDVKKLRAFLRMMRIGTEHPDRLKFPYEFKKMYSSAGKIRDRQLLLKRILEYNSTRDRRFQNKISGIEEEIKEIEEAKNKFLNEKEFIEIEKKIIKELPDIFTNDLVRSFFLKKLEAIREIISQKNYKDKELHNIRKNIKDIIYIIRIFRDDIKAPLPFLFWDKNEVKKAEDISHTLGLFNDVCIALSFLKPADIKETESAENKHLVSMRRKWLAEKRVLKKMILAKIPGVNLHIS